MVLVAWGISLSRQKPIWLDEHYTQRENIDPRTYADIWTLKISEGNKSPLFYFIQKVNADIWQFRFPSLGDIPQTALIRDAKAQWVMRLPAILCMATALVLLFYFFFRQGGWGWGLYALFVALGSPMVGMYGVEARPYALWFLLTTIQALTLWRLSTNDFKSPRLWIILFISQLALALTITTSVIQIVAATVILLFFKPARLWAILMGLISVAIAGLYYMKASHLLTYHVYFFKEHLLDNIPLEHAFSWIFLFIIILYQKWRNKLSLDLVLPTAVAFLCLFGAIAVLIKLSLKSAPYGFNSRYLIFLAPWDVILTTLSFKTLYEMAKPYRGWAWAVLVLALAAMIYRLLYGYMAALALGTYMHLPEGAGF